MSPSACLRPCAQPGCPALVRKGYCPTHAHLAPSKFADRARGSASSRGYGRAWQAIRRQVLREEPLCGECRKEGRFEPSTEVDHRIPKAAGGTDDRENLRGLCQQHHRRKTSTEAANIRKGVYRRPPA